MAIKRKIIIKSKAEFDKKFSNNYLKREVGGEVQTKRDGKIEIEEFRNGIGKEIIKRKGISWYKTGKFLEKKGVVKNQINKFKKAFEKKEAESQEKSIAQKRKVIIRRDESGSELGASGSTGLDERRGLSSRGRRSRYNVSAAQKQISTPAPQSRGGFASSSNIERTVSILSKKGDNSVVNRPSEGVAKSSGRISTGPIINNSISINKR